MRRLWSVPTRCYGINVQERGVLSQSAIVIAAGEGREDRMMSGSYVKAAEVGQQPFNADANTGPAEFYVPASPDTEQALGEDDDDPFGLR